MEIKSINAINNQKFGMAKFDNPQIIAKLTKEVPKEDALAIIQAVPKSGCKNTSIVKVATTPGYYYYDNHVIDHVTIAFPNHFCTRRVPVKYSHNLPDGDDFTSQIVEGEKALAEQILYIEAQKGNLEKTKAELIEDLPELKDYILKYSDNPGLADINGNALQIAKAREAYKKAREAYKKAHPFLSIFHIPKNIS